MADFLEPRVSPNTLTAHETVYRTLRGDIAAGRLAPGTRLVQRKLATRLGTSTIPIIDALRRLEGEGLLVTTPGIGTHVRRWQPYEIEEVFHLRAALESVAARLFATRASAADLAVLRAYHDEFEAAVRAGSVEDCRALDERLHFHIARGAQASELLRLISNSACVMLTIRNTMLPPDLRAPTVLGPPGVHTALVSALEARDPDRAETEGRWHVLEAFEHIQTHLERIRHQAEAVE